MLDKHYKVGLVIGRFQPFHNGHLYLIKEALKLCDKLIIGIGSSNVINEDNPWDANKRRQILGKVIKEEKLEDRIIKIVDIPDDSSDEVWYKTVLENAGEFDVWIGNNEWNEGIFKEHNIKVIVMPFWERYLHEGTKIRKLIKENGDWENRLPSYVVPFL